MVADHVFKGRQEEENRFVGALSDKKEVLEAEAVITSPKCNAYLLSAAGSNLTRALRMRDAHLVTPQMTPGDSRFPIPDASC